MTANSGTTQLGFIGLGNMGAPMSRRLCEAGHPLIAYDAAGTAERAPAGAALAGSTGAIAAEAEVVLLSLPDGEVVAAVAAELLEASPRRVSTVVDLSTIGPDAAEVAHTALAGGGIEYVDAPVSGGVAGARAGTLAMMVAAPHATYNRLQPMLESVAHDCFHVGERPGQGQAMKLLNNFLSGTAMVATSEALAFGVRHGLDPARTIEVLNASSGRNTATEDKFPRSVLTGSYDYGFAARLMAKDLRLFVERADRAGARHDVGEVVAETWRRLDEAMPGADFTRVYEQVIEESDSAR